MDIFNAAVLPHSSSYLAQPKWFMGSHLISVWLSRMLHGFLAYSLDVQPTNFHWGGSSFGVAVAGDPITGKLSIGGPPPQTVLEMLTSIFIGQPQGLSGSQHFRNRQQFNTGRFLYI